MHYLTLFLLYRTLYDLMEYTTQEGINKLNSEVIVEAIEILQDYLLYGETKDNKILELFCEYNFIDILKIYSFGYKDKIFISKIIKLLNALIKNISKETVFYYLMSNNFINNIISRNFIFLKNDKNFLFTYVDFLDILSIKLNINTVQFLFQEERGRFPLLDIAIKLHNYPDNYINLTIKNIILRIVKIEYKPLNRYLCELPTISYFCFLACQIKDEIINLSNEMDKKKKIKNYISDQSNIIIDNIKNNLIHIQNIFEINSYKINYIIINCMFYYCIIPYILYNLNFNKEKRKSSDKGIKTSICIFFINMLFIYIKNDIFLNILYTLIFYPYMLNSINDYMENKPIEPINYDFNWKHCIKNSSSSFSNYIKYNFNSSFLISLLYMNKSKYVEIQQIYHKYQERMINESNFNFERNKEQLLKDITKDILNKLTFSEISIMSSYHSYLSVATGLNCGISDKNKDLCIIKKMDTFFQKYHSNNEKEKTYFIPNNIKDNLFKILEKKKSYKKILLINILLKNILDENHNISKIVLKKANIIQKNYQINEVKQDNINKNENIITVNNEHINNRKYFEKEINKDNFQVINTMISINQFAENSRYTILADEIENNSREDKFIRDDTNNKNNLFTLSSFQKRNKYLLLNHEYFNIFENEISTQNDYHNEKIADILISLLDTNNNVGILSLKLTLENILSLIKKSKQIFIPGNRKNKISLIYKKFKDEILYYYNNKKSFHNNAYQLFIKQYYNYLQLSNLDYKNIVKHCIESDSSEDSFLYYNNIKNNKGNKFDILILSFLLIHDFYYEFLSYDNDKNDIAQFNYKNKLYLNNYFPLLNQSISLVLNKKYYLIDLDPNVKYYECKCKIIVDKKNKSENFFDSHMLLLDNFIFIGDSSENNSYTIIKYKFLASCCLIQVDNYNNKNINIYFNNNIYDNNDIEIFVDFKNYNIAKKVIYLIDKEIKKSKFYEKEKINKFIQSI